MPMECAEIELAGLIAEHDQVCSIEPWSIARAAPNGELAAKEALEREGFETFVPTYRKVVSVPLRKVPPKKRRGARDLARVVERPLFPGYVFFRRVCGAYDLFRLHELTGVIGFVHFGEVRVSLPDYVIELIRLKAGDGVFDQLQAALPRRAQYRLLDAAERDKKWIGKTRLIGRACESRGIVMFVAELGRVVRLIERAATKETGRSRA